MRWFGVAAAVLFGCGGGAGDRSGAPIGDDAASAAIEDAAILDGASGGSRDGDGAGGPDGGAFMPTEQRDDPVAHAAPTTISVQRLGSGARILDVGADRGGGIWAVDATTVYFWPSVGAAPRRYAAADGLARRSAANPFASIAGGIAGQAIIGNRGAIADVLEVEPSSGAVRRIQNMVVPPFDGPEYHEHLIRVTHGLRVIADIEGTLSGTAYIGGIHGFTAWHGLAGDCRCEQFQEHQHFIPSDEMGNCDSTMPRGNCWSGDVKGLAISPTGDVWVGDEHFVALLPQRSLGLHADFFQPFALGIDVFPGEDDEVSALAVDPSGGVWVASFGLGLAYLTPMTFQPSYFDRARGLPQNRIVAVAVDDDGGLWVGSFLAGVARFKDGRWIYHTAASGLPSDDVTSIFIDRTSTPRRVLIGTLNGIAVYSGE